MPLPIIIIVERHWDTAPKKALMKALPFLTGLGYDTLCCESPYDKNQQETIGAIEHTIGFIETRLTEANQCLAKRQMFHNLPEMDYLALQSLLRDYVSSKYFKEMALWFKELPGHQQKLMLIREAVESRMQICGIDLTSEQLQSINSFEAQLNLGDRLSGIHELDDMRIKAFKLNMLERQQQGKGVVFVVGQYHYQRLIEVFSKDYLLSEIIFLHPYSSKCLDKSHVDYELPSYASMEDLILIEKVIDNDKGIEHFLTDLRHTVQPVVDNFDSIARANKAEKNIREQHLYHNAEMILGFWRRHSVGKEHVIERHLALRLKKICTVETILNAVAEKKYSLALRKACFGLQLPVVKLLLQCGISLEINEITSKNQTALDLVQTAKGNKKVKEEIETLVKSAGGMTAQALEKSALSLI